MYKLKYVPEHDIIVKKRLEFCRNQVIEINKFKENEI